LFKSSGSTSWACAVNGDPTSNAAADDQDSGAFANQTTSATADMHLTATFTSATTVVLRCRAADGNVSAKETKIIATPLGGTNRVVGSAGAAGS